MLELAKQSTYYLQPILDYHFSLLLMTRAHSGNFIGVSGKKNVNAWLWRGKKCHRGFKKHSPLFGIYIAKFGVCACLRNTRLVSSSEQVVSHLVQIGCFASVDEEHHLFKDLSLHVVYLHSVLGRKSQQNRVNLKIPVSLLTELLKF